MAIWEIDVVACRPPVNSPICASCAIQDGGGDDIGDGDGKRMEEDGGEKEEEEEEEATVTTTTSASSRCGRMAKKVYMG